MTCHELAEFLMAYLDGELPAAQREEFERHSADCPPCKAYLRSYRQTIALGRSICHDPEGPVPEQVPEDLVLAILAARKKGT
jgi:anti-sigma factor RsiW